MQKIYEQKRIKHINTLKSYKCEVYVLAGLHYMNKL